MNKDEYQKMYNLENSYWWHVGRQSIISSFLNLYLSKKENLKILNIGCGTGANFKILKKFGKVTGIDSSEEALKFCHKQEFNNVRLGKAERLDFKNESFDLITVLDVLEHLNDDQKALREFYRVLKKGGQVLITVPAYRFLWSEHDEALHHRRRYMASDLHIRLNNAGFQVLRRSYCISFAFPAILAYKLFRGLFPKSPDKPKTSYIILPKVINNFLILLLKLEAFLLKHIDFPIGTSIISLARK